MKDILAFFAIILFILFLFFLIGLTGCQWMKGGGLQDSDSVDSSAPSIPSIPKSINWLAAMSILGLAFSVAALVNGYKWGLGGAVGSGIALWAVITVNQYAKWIAVIGLLVGIIVLVVAALRNKNVLVDVIKSVEAGKKKIAPVWENSLKVTLTDQKPLTQKIVNKIRKKLNGEKKNGKGTN